MAKYFKNVASYEDLKSQFKQLLKSNHPDNGGDVAVMQEINAEYDALFKIWKDKQEQATGEKVTETADSTRQNFYTEFGWEGSNHDWNRSLKEVAQIVRGYVKEKYPTYKFSVRTSYASMCQELHVDLKESPCEIYKTFEELTDEDKNDLLRKMRYNNYFKLDCWYEHELKAEFERIWNEHGNFFKCLNEVTQAVVDDVDAFVKSYNYSDCDGMIDYFNVDFYYFGCCQNNGQDIKIVPKTARLKKNEDTPVKTKNTRADEVAALEDNENKKYSCTVSEGEDTRDLSQLWVVRINETLDKEEYIKMNNTMKELGGYYSKFKHGFIFRENPTEKLKGVSIEVKEPGEVQSYSVRRRGKSR